MLPLLLLLACGSPAPVATPPPPPADHARHAELFDREWVEPVPGVHMAIGYALANVIVLEGPDGLVIVDTTESRTAAEEVLADLRTRTDKPIEAIILTHNHADHIFGGAVFAEGRDIPVYAHETTDAAINRVVNVLRDTLQVRSARMFGTPLAPAEVLHCGIGKELRFDIKDIALLRPTETFSTSRTIEAAGLTLELHHAPGETDDQLFVWWADKRVLLPGDNVYQAFPNLYTIRGTPYRDVLTWVRSVDHMRELEPAVLVPSHTRPVVGAKEIDDILMAYRDAIQFVHDQTIRHMNLGQGPDDLVQTVQLPAHLRDHPWLVEQYGRVSWSVRSVFAGYLGWFDGDPTTLEPLAPDALAQHWSDALAAHQSLPDQARAAVEAGELKWAGELLRHWRRLEPDNAEARTLLAEVFERRANDHHNPNALHWYRVAAKELRGEVVVHPSPTSDAPSSLLESLPLEAFLFGMSTRLRAEDALETDLVAQLVFTDVDRSFTIHIRRGVAAIHERVHTDPAFTITTTTSVWKHVAARKRNPAAAILSGELSFSGEMGALTNFLALFRR